MVIFPFIALALVAGVLGGLARVGVSAGNADWLGQAAVWHGALMIGAFMGSVIAIERAVALKLRWAWAAPACSAAGGLALLAGLSHVGAILLVMSSVVFTAVNWVLVQRQRADHTVLLLASALAWLVGNGLLAAGWGQLAVPCWFSFLVITIAAERLEMTRLMRRRPGAHALLYSIVAALLAGALVSGVLFGIALVALAGWLFTYDIARRTVFAQGLTRYMAICLLGGYAWLAIAGVAWVAASRDLALHALGLGFIVSMMMGHAPVILPAVARVKLLFGGWFYVPLAALHASLAVRFLSERGPGAVGNALAIVLFIATVVASAIAFRRRHP
ncbi:MAG: hypothetical protein HY854_05200 [Burkholderiales bacterium]|nr:hypothetical protein [Burkholderiales bacterium]